MFILLNLHLIVHNSKRLLSIEPATMTGTNGNGSNGNGARVGTDRVKQGLAQMLKGGVIVSVAS